MAADVSTTLMESAMSSPQAVAIGFAAGFLIAFLWQKFGKRNNGLGGGF
mgnify:CR=1 FL=1